MCFKCNRICASEPGMRSNQMKFQPMKRRSRPARAQRFADPALSAARDIWSEGE
jgi:hypothetical protein